jgi:hypothetical protein
VVFPGQPAVSETPPIQPGSALASSTLARVDVIYGKFSFPFSVGDSRASYQTSESVAVSHGINLGALNGSGGSSPCDAGGGSDSGTPAPNQAPPFRPLTLSSRDGDDSSSYGTAPIAVGDVSVKGSPLSATSHTSSMLIDIPGILTVKGHTDAGVDFTDGAQRAASSGASIDVVLMGGLVRLKGLTWEASALSGAKKDSSAGFSAASIVVGGQSQAVDTEQQLADAIAAANTALSATGLVIDMPEVEDTAAGSSASGMVLHINGNDQLAAVAALLFDIKTPIQQAIGELIRSLPNCQLSEQAGTVGVAELVLDVIVGGLVGEGGIDLTLGGASASTAPPPDFENPFGNGSPPPSGGGTPSDDDPPVVASGPVQGAPIPTGEVPQTPVVAGQPGQALYTVGCASTNTVDTDPCSSGAGSKAFYALLLGALALFAGDLYQSRRPRPIVRRSVS